MRGIQPWAVMAATLLAVICTRPAPAQTPPVEAAAPDAASAETTVATSMSDTDRMLVPVTIGGAGPYSFIIDTAAERSVIARDLARQLGLAPAGSARLLSMTSS